MNVQVVWLVVLILFFVVKFPAANTIKMEVRPPVSAKYRDRSPSAELQNLLNADQQDRLRSVMTKVELAAMVAHDSIRRKRVAEIFAEGDIRTAADYMAAALIFQHGIVSDHFFQAFIWAKRAAELGDSHAKLLSALAIDRYLISQGKKQIFGSQYSDRDSPRRHCFCMQPVEKSFPDSVRLSYAGRSLQDQYQVMATIINRNNNCPKIECQQQLQPTPKGSIPGFW